MKNLSVFVFLFLLLNVPSHLSAQFAGEKYYFENSGEFIFSFADYTVNGISVNTPVRFSMFFHAGNNFHYNFTDNIGVYSGWALRNIGFTSEDAGIKYKRRTYSIGMPLALKIGSFSNQVYLYGGASYELFFHYKQKRFVDGEKQKYSEWFSDRTERFSPSFFAGIQFPKGINLKFKYYPNDFLNRDFVGRDFGEIVDYSRFTRSNLFYVALSFNINPKTFDIDKNLNKETNFISYFRKN